MTKPKAPGTLKKRGPKPKTDGAPPAASPPTASSPSSAAPATAAGSSVAASDPKPAVSTSKLHALGLKALEDRKGDATKGKVRAAASPLPKGQEAAKRKTIRKEDVDEGVCEMLGKVVADGEAAFALAFVPPEYEGKVEKSSKVLAWAWKYFFIQNGVESLPSWLVLLFAHLAFIATCLRPNTERIGVWFEGMKAKFTGKPVKKPETEHTPKPQTPAQESKPDTVGFPAAPVAEKSDVLGEKRQGVGIKPPDPGAKIAENATILNPNTPLETGI